MEDMVGRITYALPSIDAVTFEEVISTFNEGGNFEHVL